MYKPAPSLEAPFGRDAIYLWYAAPLHTLEAARLVHRALNPPPGFHGLRHLFQQPAESLDRRADVKMAQSRPDVGRDISQHRRPKIPLQGLDGREAVPTRP